MKGYRESGIFGKAKVISQIIMHRNSIICHDYNRKAELARVNLNYWKLNSKNDIDNLGDYLSVVVVENMLRERGLSLDTSVRETKHLYAIGSILMTGFQDSTIWGTGILGDIRVGIEGKMAVLVNKHIRRLDVRAVRGPKTRDFLLDIGIECPEVYGDPAILMPLFYMPENSVKTREYLVINHYTKSNAFSNDIDLRTKDYRGVIDRICSAKKIITGSLHGLILAEAYGVPAVLLNDREDFSSFKYEDYYHSTGRFEFPVANSIDEAVEIEPLEIPDMQNIRKGLIKAFPYDLWSEQV